MRFGNEIPVEDRCMMPGCELEHDTVLSGFKFCVTHAGEAVKLLLTGK